LQGTIGRTLGEVAGLEPLPSVPPKALLGDLQT